MKSLKTAAMQKLMLKKWYLNNITSSIVAGIIGFVIFLTLKSIRWQRQDESGIEATKSKTPVIFTIWHGKLFAAPMILNRYPEVACFISPSNDGKIISRVFAFSNIKTIWGSSNNKPVSGYRELLKHLKRGGKCGITPDGPRGPARKVALGTISLAKNSNTPIVPVAWATSRMKKLNSWDEFIIPIPFSRGIKIIGAPIIIPRDATLEAMEVARLHLENELNRLTVEAEKFCGLAPTKYETRYGVLKEKR